MGGTGGGSGGSGDGSGSSGSGGSAWWPLLWAAVWAVFTEAWSILQYREMAARDARRRAELFPADAQQQVQQERQQHQHDMAAAAEADVAAGRGARTTEPVVSIIMPVLNEEAGIEEAIRYLQQQLHPSPAEIIVVDGGSRDGTVAAARRCGVRVLQAGRGRARQMNAGAAAARGELSGKGLGGMGCGQAGGYSVQHQAAHCCAFGCQAALPRSWPAARFFTSSARACPCLPAVHHCALW